MENNENELTTLLKEVIENYNIYGLDQIVAKMDTEEVQKNKNQLTDAYLTLYSYLLYDLDCNRINEEDQEDLIFDLIDMLDSAEKIDPEIIYYFERAACFNMITEIKTEIADKLIFKQKAIEVYKNATQYPEQVQLNSRLAGALLDKIEIEKHFKENSFSEVLQLLELAYMEYSENVMRDFLYSSFSILKLSFNQKDYFHKQFINRFNFLTNELASTDHIIYLRWAEELRRIIDSDYYNISPTYIKELNFFLSQLLSHLIHYSTENTDILNKLGFAFEKSAQTIEDEETKKIFYFENALKFFEKGQSINPYAWTFPVYATNVIKQISKIFYLNRDQEKVIEMFEKGKKIFELNPEKDFTLAHYYGQFLIEYARLAYDFKAINILNEAKEVLLIAKDLGNNYYDGPFLNLAKIALKLGDYHQCIEILKECKQVFTTKYSVYSLSKVLEDEDFTEIWDNGIFAESRSGQ